MWQIYTTLAVFQKSIACEHVSDSAVEKSHIWAFVTFLEKYITFQLFSNLELLYVWISALSENKMRSYYAYNFQIDFSVLLYNYF